MKKFIATLESVSAYAQGRYHDTPKLPRENESDYEARTVHAKLHTAVGQIFIPPLAFKLCMETTARYLGEKVPDKGQATYTKFYRQGLICTEPILLNLTPEQVRVARVFIPSQPSKPKGGRVWKLFPVIDQWEGQLSIIAIDDLFTPQILLRHLTIGGLINGIGVWRPENGGLWGKFKVRSLDEEEI
jgi:hypothetical protein